MLGTRRRSGFLAIMMPMLFGLLLLCCACRPPDTATPSVSSDYEFSDEGSFDSEGNFTSPAQTTTDTFSCLGITDEQFKSILKPASYATNTGPCELITPAVPPDTGPTYIRFGVWGVPNSHFYIPPFGWDDQYLPYCFYVFPSQMGVGGAWWQHPIIWRGAMASPSADAVPVVALVSDRGRGDWMIALSVYSGSWHMASPFKGDTIATMIMLIEWVGRYLAQQYPSVFPASLLADNPSPYVPPSNGALPTSTTTLPALPSLSFSSAP